MPSPSFDQKTKEAYDKLRAILTGKESVKFYLEFLKRNNQTDPLILKNSKVKFRSDFRGPICSLYYRMH